MARARTLTRSELARGLAASKGDTDEIRAFAEDFDPDVFEAWQGWVWGRHTFDLKIGKPDEIPAKVSVFSSLSAIEYIARKKDPDGIARRATYRHVHSKPYATIATTSAGAPRGPVIASRGRTPKRKTPSLFVLGELYGLEGVDPTTGDLVYWRAPRGVLLAGCPLTHDMHVIRTGAARATCAPIWILRGHSPYRLTDRGIER